MKNIYYLNVECDFPDIYPLYIHIFEDVLMQKNKELVLV